MTTNYDYNSDYNLEILQNVEVTTLVEMAEDLDPELYMTEWNDYQNEIGGDPIYPHDEEFFELFYGDKPDEAVRASYYGHYNYNDPYIVLNSLGNLDTYSSVNEYIEFDSDFIFYAFEHSQYYNTFLEGLWEVYLEWKDSGTYIEYVDDFNPDCELESDNEEE